MEIGWNLEICPCPKNASVWCIPVCPSACRWNELLQQIQHSLNVKMANHRWSACQYLHIQWGLFYVRLDMDRCWEYVDLPKSWAFRNTRHPEKLPKKRNTNQPSPCHWPGGVSPVQRLDFVWFTGPRVQHEGIQSCAWYRSTLFEPSICWWSCSPFANPSRVRL